MKVVKCINGHYFDNDEFKECPVCGEGIGSAFVSSDDEKTEYMFSRNPVSEERSEVITETKDEPVVPAYTETDDSSHVEYIHSSGQYDDSYSREQVQPAEELPPLDKKKIIIAVSAILGLLLLIALLTSLIKGLKKEKTQDPSEELAVTQEEKEETSDDVNAEVIADYKDGDVIIVDSETDEGIILGGYLSSGRTQVSFTLPLPKNAENVDAEFKSLKLNIRHAEGGYLLSDEYVPGGYDVISDSKLEVKSVVTAGFYLTVTITSSEKFEITNNTPLAITIADMELHFSGK